MISSNQIIGSLIYRTRQALRENKKFIGGLNSGALCPYGGNYFLDGAFNIMHYPGTISEIKNVLIELDKDVAIRHHKYPAVFNFVPRIEEVTATTITATYNLVFAAIADRNWLTEEREKYVFEPVLRPIYMEFMNQIKNAEFLHPRPSTIPPHRKIEVFTTGELSPANLVPYNDYIDAIEVHNLQLSFRNCEYFAYKKAIEENNLLTIF